MKTLPLRNLLGRVALSALLPLCITACDDPTPSSSDTEGGTDSSDDDDDGSDTNVTVTVTSPTTMTDTTPTTETGETETTDDTDSTVGDTETTVGDTGTTTGDTTTGDTTTGDTEETTGDTEETTGVKGDCEVIEVGNLTAFPTANGFDIYLPIATPNTGAVEEDEFQMRFYAETQGDVDLVSAVNAEFSTCEQCLLYLQDFDVDGNASRVLYQSAGSINVDPTSGSYAATMTFTGVELVEVTIDDDGTVPVKDGACIEITDGAAVTVPPEWSCGLDAYGDGASCDCGCGAPDPDCADAMATSCDECNGTGSCAEGDADCAGIEPDDNASCLPSNPLCMDDSVAGELDAVDPLFTRTFGVGADCALSASGVDVSYDVLNFTAPAGGINITADTCDAEFDSFISLYQAADGSADPFDPANPCTNLVQADDDGCVGGTSGSSFLTAEGLVAGEYQVVVTQFSALDFDGDPDLGAYTMTQVCI